MITLKSKYQNMKTGDIYQTKLKDGRFGAVIILKTVKIPDFSKSEFFLVGVTTYIDTKEPTVEDIRLKKILVREYSFPKGSKVIHIYSGKFPKIYKYIGNITIPHEEQNIQIKIGDGTNGGFPLRGTIGNFIGSEVLMEWKYKYDKENFLKQIEASQLEYAKNKQKNRSTSTKKPINDGKFWEIISLLDWNQKNDNKILGPAIQALSKLKIAQIKEFEEALAYKLYQLDTKEHSKEIEVNGYLSPDFFLYARCFVVAKGKLFYEEVLQHPSKIPKDGDFEALLDVSPMAYELKTGKEWDYDTEVSYETYSNEKGWE